MRSASATDVLTIEKDHDGLANARDFPPPVAAFEDAEGEVELVQKYLGRLWTTTLDHSPLDVVAWHGNLAPWRYDLKRLRLGRLSQGVGPGCRLRIAVRPQSRRASIRRARSVSRGRGRARR